MPKMWGMVWNLQNHAECAASDMDAIHVQKNEGCNLVTRQIKPKKRDQLDKPSIQRCNASPQSGLGHQNRVPANCLGCCLEGQVFTLQVMLQHIVTSAKSKTATLCILMAKNLNRQLVALNEMMYWRNCPISV